MNFIKQNLQHAPGCPGKPYALGTNKITIAPCTCGHTEALARLEAMEAFVGAFKEWRDSNALPWGDLYGAIFEAYKAVEGE